MTTNTPRAGQLKATTTADAHITLGAVTPQEPTAKEVEGKAVAKLSPRVVSIAWGRMYVSGSIGKVKDVKLWPGGGRAWDWGETGTRHSPGIQLADIEELLDHGATTVVLSRGMDEKLGVPDVTVRALEDRGIEVHVAETRAAVDIYNKLISNSVRVGGLFHSTC